MKLKSTLCAAIALSVVSTSFAFAQTRSNAEERQRALDTGVENALDPGNRAGRRGYGRQESSAWTNNRHDAPREYRRWNRGDRLPAEYRDRQYVVNDWRGHNLNAPPGGYQWVQSGSDYLLVAIATGLIAQLLSQ